MVIKTHNPDHSAIYAAAKELDSYFITHVIEMSHNNIEPNSILGGGEGEKIFRHFLFNEYGKVMSDKLNILRDNVASEMIKKSNSTIPINKSEELENLISYSSNATKHLNYINNIDQSEIINHKNKIDSSVNNYYNQEERIMLKAVKDIESGKVNEIA